MLAALSCDPRNAADDMHMIRRSDIHILFMTNNYLARNTSFSHLKNMYIYQFVDRETPREYIIGTVEEICSKQTVAPIHEERGLRKQTQEAKRP